MQSNPEQLMQTAIADVRAQVLAELTAVQLDIRDLDSRVSNLKV
jgi:hypothetical protein